MVDVDSVRDGDVAEGYGEDGADGASGWDIEKGVDYTGSAVGLTNLGGSGREKRKNHVECADAVHGAFCAYRVRVTGGGGV